MILSVVTLYTQKIRALVDDNKWKQLETWLNSTTQMTKIKAIQMQKFDCLQAKQPGTIAGQGQTSGEP